MIQTSATIHNTPTRFNAKEKSNYFAFSSTKKLQGRKDYILNIHLHVNILKIII